jgi:hypothetical protein
LPQISTPQQSTSCNNRQQLTKPNPVCAPGTSGHLLLLLHYAALPIFTNRDELLAAALNPPLFSLSPGTSAGNRLQLQYRHHQSTLSLLQSRPQESGCLDSGCRAASQCSSSSPPAVSSRDNTTFRTTCMGASHPIPHSSRAASPTTSRSCPSRASQAAPAPSNVLASSFTAGRRRRIRELWESPSALIPCCLSREFSGTSSYIVC